LVKDILVFYLIVMISIIIPTLNEENYLPLLLDSIKRQGIDDLEIIVADAGSQDKTLEVARNFGCKIVKGGLPARGRNEGAKIAKGDLLLFLDADTLLPENSLKVLLEEFSTRQLDIASCGLMPFGNNKFLYFLYDFFYNRLAILFEKKLPPGAGLIIAKKELHKHIGGFDETIKMGEDHSYARKGAKSGKYGFLRSVKIHFSQRRFKEEGWFKTYLKYWLAFFYVLFRGDIKSDIFEYRFGSHKTKPF
jgi:glycosyltransferase involved in cell wall biosynthesis